MGHYLPNQTYHWGPEWDAFLCWTLIIQRGHGGTAGSKQKWTWLRPSAHTTCLPLLNVSEEKKALFHHSVLIRSFTAQVCTLHQTCMLGVRCVKHGFNNTCRTESITAVMRLPMRFWGWDEKVNPVLFLQMPQGPSCQCRVLWSTGSVWMTSVFPKELWNFFPQSVVFNVWVNYNLFFRSY